MTRIPRFIEYAKAVALIRYTITLCAACALLAGCGGAQPPINAPGAMPQSGAVRALPSDLLYVAGGPSSTVHPSIEVFNALDNSQNPKPIYTIGPRGGGTYDLLAVDAANNLYVVNFFANGAKLLTFPSGKTQPDVECVLDNVPHDTFIAGKTFYSTTKNYTIEEYALPIRRGKACPKPARVLTDERAELRGYQGLWGVAVDPHGDIFDIWQPPNGEKIDEFPAGSAKARRFASLKQTEAAFYMTSDRSGNVITNFGSEAPQSDSIVVFRPGGRTHKLFYPISNGAYLGVALADKNTELFAAKDYPQTTVSAYSYDPSRGRVGRVLRTFSLGIWVDAQSIAVFSGK